jgi:hypothetical protein
LPGAFAPAKVKIVATLDAAVWHKKSRVAKYLLDISATRLSQGDPVGFPSHSREWFSIIV